MALISTDETDLLLPLYGGVQETPRFSTFLNRLQRRTRADYVGLVCRQGDVPVGLATEFFAGRDLRAEAGALGMEDAQLFERFPFERLRPGRVYSVEEFIGEDPAYLAFRERYSRGLRIVDERVLRINGEDGVSAWMVIARSVPCSASDSALLTALGPHVAMALRNLVVMERQAIQERMGRQSLASLGAGWILFDRHARVISFDAATAERLAASTGATLVTGERVRGLDGRSDRLLADCAQAFASDPSAVPRAVTLGSGRSVELQLRPDATRPAATPTLPAMLAICRFEMARGPHRAEMLASLFDLPKRQAELAICLSDGLSIMQAARHMGLTLETARNYSKQLYATMGVRGQAELVGRVKESCAMLT